MSCQSLAATPSNNNKKGDSNLSVSPITGRAILPGPSGYGAAGTWSGDLAGRASFAFRSLVDWNVCEDYTQYLKKCGHVSPQCELVREEEQLLVAIVYAEGASATAHRTVIDAAVGGSAKTAAMSPGALAASAQHPSLDVRQRDAYLYGQIEADVAASAAKVDINISTCSISLGGHMYRALESSCESWLTAYRDVEWKVRLYYRRPASGSLKGQGLIASVTLVWDEPSAAGMVAADGPWSVV